MSFLGVVAIIVVTVYLLVTFLYPPLWKDLVTLKILLIFLRKLSKAYRNKILVIDRFEQHAKGIPDRVFLLYKDESYTYKMADNMATKVARALMCKGVEFGDTVALIMSNEPAFVWIYLGVQKIGARLSMINHHLMSDSLRRSVEACHPKIVLVGDGLTDYLPSRVAGIASSFQEEIAVYCFNRPREGVDLPCFLEIMQEVSDQPIDPSGRSQIKLSDASVFIYTSGTTGLPKPAIITHKKAIGNSLTYGPVGFSSKDILYLALPLYHASAVNLAMLNVIQDGATFVLKDKFSASQFWPDCVHYKVTIVQYIGELFRYLTNRPVCPEEAQHKIWALVGNGMRLDVWRQVTTRFKIKKIFEFYGSTELPGGINNHFGQEGSVGRLSPLLSRLSGHILVDIDETTKKPYRNAKGRCRETKPGSHGVFLARLSDKVIFDGYLGPGYMTSDRIIKDVLKEGDFYVNSSDVFILDKEYNLYFMDRLGDSFRWKGENVSTTEVSSVINQADFVQDANVYGVEVPGCEGKAGMAAITLKEGQDLDDEKIEHLGQLVRDKLPAYARPRFLRFQRQMSLTSTFKHMKMDLVKDGFDLNNIKDESVLYLDRKNNSFHSLDSDKQNQIIKGEITM